MCSCGKAHYGLYKNAHETCSDCKEKASKTVCNFFRNFKMENKK